MKIKAKRKIVRRKFGFFSGFLIAVLLIASVTLFLIAFDEYSKNNQVLGKQEVPQGVQEIINTCSNKSLIDAGNCVNSIFKEFWKYNESNIGKNLSFEEIKDSGGVCSHASEIYKQIGEGLGFYVYTPIIKTGYENRTINNKTKEYQINHEFAVWVNSEGYLILDQRKMFSFIFAD